MKAQRFLVALLMSMLIACWPGNAWATVTQTVTAGFNEGQAQHVTINDNVEVSNETNAVLVEAYAPEEVEDKTASATVNGNVTLTNTSGISVVYAEGRNGDASAKITGNITGTSDGAVNGIEAWGHSFNGNGDVYVTAGGNVSAESTLSNASGITSDYASVNVTEDVTAKGNYVYGVESYNDNKLTIGGNVSSEGEISTGMYAYSDKKTEIGVKGGVSSTGNYTKGLQIESSSGGDLSVAVGNGIQATVPGTEPEDWYSAGGVSFYSSGGKLAANINGNVEAKAANGGAIGIRTDHNIGENGSPFGNGSSEILVHGNVISDGVGVVLDTFGENTNVNVLVEDEIQAKAVGVAIGRTYFAENSSETEPELTVWKIGLNTNGKVVEWGDFGFNDPYDDEYKAKATADFEKHIMYIAKVEQPSTGGTLKAVDANGNDLPTSYDFPVAHEGEKIILKPNLQSGWKIKAAYNGEGANKQQLSKDQSGNYYIIVPKGGGIDLSADVEKEPVKIAIPTGKTLTYNGKSRTGVAAGTGYTLSGTKSATKAGSYQAKATLKNGYIWKDGTTAAKTIKWKINKAANPLTIKAKTATVKGSTKGKKGTLKKTKKLAVTKVIKFTKQGQGTMTYTKAGGNKKITINKKTGKVTVTKGLKKGTYQVKVKVKAGGNANYKASAVKAVTFKVIVK